MGANALLALELASQAVAFLAQLHTMMQNAAANNTDLTDSDLATLKSGYASMKDQVDKFIQTAAPGQTAVEASKES